MYLGLHTNLILLVIYEGTIITYMRGVVGIVPAVFSYYYSIYLPDFHDITEQLQYLCVVEKH